MTRTIEQAAPGFLPIRTRQGWALVREEYDAGGTLVELTPVVDSQQRLFLWRGRDGRRRAVGSSWGLQRDAEIAALRAELARLKASEAPAQSADHGADFVALSS